MKDITKQSFEQSASIYDRDDLMEEEAHIIKKYFKGKKVLDLGCGAGRTTVNLRKKGFDVIGIDYAGNLIKRARQKYPKLDFRVMDASALKFKDGSFDIAFFSYNGLDYLYPLKARIKAINEAKRVLKNSGIFIYSSHKRFYFWFPLKLKFPFIRIHYLLTMFASIFAFNWYRWEKHPFGWIRSYCRNNSSDEPLSAGFEKVLIIPSKSWNHYICYKK